jgi:hypothetical protein
MICAVPVLLYVQQQVGSRQVGAIGSISKAAVGPLPILTLLPNHWHCCLFACKGHVPKFTETYLFADLPPSIASVT